MAMNSSHCSLLRLLLGPDMPSLLFFQFSKVEAGIYFISGCCNNSSELIGANHLSNKLWVETTQTWFSLVRSTKSSIREVSANGVKLYPKKPFSEGETPSESGTNPSK